MTSQTGSSAIFDTLGITAAALAAYRARQEAARRQAYAQAIQYYDEALSFTETPDLFRARTYEYRGQCYWLLNEPDAAERDYQAALTVSDDDEQIARARVRLGELADFCGQYDEAARIYAQALAEGIAAQNLLVIGRARRGLGILNRRQGNTELAITQLTQALAAFREAREAREQARVLTSLGRTRYARGEYQHALSAHSQALTILESLQDRWRVVQALTDIGECHQALYDIEKALGFHQKALRLANEYGADVLKPEIQRNLGVDLVEMGEYDAGLASLMAALKGTRKIGNREQEALALYNLARAYMQRSHIALAKQAVQELNNVAEELDADRYRALAAFVQGELLFQQGDREAAVAELNTAMLAAQTSVDRGVLWKLHATMSHVTDNKAIAAVHRTIAAEFIRQTAEPLQDADLKKGFVYAPPVLAVLQAAGIDPDKL